MSSASRQWRRTLCQYPRVSIFAAVQPDVADMPQIAERTIDIVVARTHVLGRDADGSIREIRFAIGRPEKISDGAWSCPVEINGLPAVTTGTLGCDSWQALTVAIGLVKQGVLYYLSDGGTLLRPDDEREMAVDDLFPEF